MFTPSQAARRGDVPEKQILVSLATGRDAVRLDAGEPGFATPEHIREAAANAIRQGYTKYPPKPGDPELRAALAEKVSRISGLAYGAGDILVTNGGTEAVFVAMSGYVDPGDEIVFFDPSYWLYSAVAQQIGAKPVFVHLAEGFRLDRHALERALSPRCKMLVLCNPSNPTGSVFSPSDMEALAEVVLKHDLLLVADEVYDHIVYDNAKHISTLAMAGLADRTLYVNSFSKTYAMAGWRVGYLAARSGLIKAPSIIHENTAGWVNAVAQRAALAALTGPTDWQAPMLQGYVERRRTMCDRIHEIDGLSCGWPEGTFYAFVKFDYGMSSFEMARHLTNHGVAVRTGSEFGRRGEGYLRLSFTATRDVILGGMKRLEQALEALG